MTSLITHRGGCHCARVRFEVDAPFDLDASRCNCSICYKTGFLHLIVPAARFRLLTPWDEIATYTFNTGIAKHHFCRTCGIKSFYVPRSNPEGFSVNVRCLDEGSFGEVRISDFDGRNWEAHASTLAHLSHPDDAPPPPLPLRESGRPDDARTTPLPLRESGRPDDARTTPLPLRERGRGEG